MNNINVSGGIYRVVYIVQTEEELTTRLAQPFWAHTHRICFIYTICIYTSQRSFPLANCTTLRRLRLSFFFNPDIVYS